MSNLYYAYNAFVVMGPALILWFKRDEIKLDFARYVRVLLFVSLPFIIWDIWAAAEGHWGFSDRYIRGPYIAGIPLEELLFFVTVPFAMLFVWEVVKKHFRDRILQTSYIQHAIGLLATVMATLLLQANWDKGYTRSVALAFIVVNIFLWLNGWYHRVQFWIFQALHLGLFFVMNTFLTSLPVITYGEGSYIGFRIGTIPVEDFLFSYALIGASLLVYTMGNAHERKNSQTKRASPSV